MNRARMAWWIALASATGCVDKGSLGEYESSSGDPGDATASASHSETSLPTTTASSSVSGTDGEVPNRCPDGQGCPNFPPCGDECGEAQSPFDEDGCLRPTCQGDEECATGERCFVGSDFGLCEPSTMTCYEDLEGPDPGCACGGPADCGGGHCVPEALYPAELYEGDLSVAMLIPTCGPADEPMYGLVYYGDGGFNYCMASDDAIVELLVAFEPGEQLIGEHETRAGSTAGYHRADLGVLQDVLHGRLVIDGTYDDVEGQHAMGHFEVTVIADGELRVVSGDIPDLELCPAEHSCP